MHIDFTFRTLQLSDWATILFLLSFGAIIVNKSMFSTRFAEFSRLIFSDKYLKIYKDSSNISSPFTISMFFVQLVSFSFFIFLILHTFTQTNKSDGVLFFQIFAYLSIFILSKYLIEKVIAVVFNLENFVEQFNLQKVGYRAFIGFILFPVVVILYYNSVNSVLIYYTLISILLFFNILTYFNILKSHQSLLLNKIFYFILYLCAFEIAPYYFIYYWITKHY